MNPITLTLTVALLVRISAVEKVASDEAVWVEPQSRVDGNVGHRTLSVLSGNVFGVFKQENTASSCLYQPSEFESVVVADFLGVPELMTTEELKLLGETFAGSYNALANNLCDSERRKVKSVTIKTDEFRQSSGRHRSLQDTHASFRANTNYPSRRFSLKVLVLGNCRRCEKDTSLFDDAFRRQRMLDTPERLSTQGLLQSDISPVDYAGKVIDNRPIDIPEKGQKYLLPNAKNCDCETTGELPYRAPGLDEFNLDYGDRVQRLADKGSLENVKKSLGVSQLVPVDCANLNDEFFSEILVEAKGASDLITSQEFEVMRDLFITSYKSCTENVCDRQFRNLSKATVTVDGEERRLAFSSDFSDLEGNSEILDVGKSARFRPFRFKFRVSGMCKGCKSEDRLFDDAFRRGLGVDSFFFPFIDQMRRDLGYIFSDNECYCVANAPQRAPFAEEFQVVLSQSVEDEVRAGTLTNVVSTGTVTQLDNSIESFSPSLAPTTSYPSPSPTIFPTQLPTTYPTETPSTTESSMPSTPRPSEGPSLSPSNPTVPTESPVPSPSPSAFPSG